MAYVKRLLAEGKYYYATKYRGRGETIHLVGVEFSRATRNITVFEVADPDVPQSTTQQAPASM